MKDLKLYTFIAFILLGFYILAQYKKPKPINWAPTFAKKDKIPYGSLVIFNRLNDLFPNSSIRTKRETPYVTLVEQSYLPGNYLLISQKIKVDEYDFKELEKYMRKGNNVFIATFELSNFLKDSLQLQINSETKVKEDIQIPLSFVNQALASKTYSFKKGVGDQYFSDFDSTKAVVLGKNSRDHANFIKYQYGKGGLYVVASPMFFTNFTMLQKDGADYVSKVLSYLPAKQEIIWDEYSTFGREGEESPLRVILSIQALKWAYLLSVFALLIFVLYEMKRRQRIIPIIEPLKNTSAEFVKVVGQVYYQKRDNQNIAQKKAAYFLEEIRSRYAIKTTLLNQEFERTLNTKSGVRAELISELVSKIIQTSHSKKITDHELTALNRSIEQFHQQSKI